jgi:5-methylcytosine-specific restriction endonuclease McrA
MAIKDRPYLKSFLINALRRASYRWPSRYKAAKRSHIGRNTYFCEECGVIGTKKETQMDHTIPAVDPVDGWIDLDVFADRLYCEEEGWRRLCIPCHSAKTSIENDTRKLNRKPRKKKT